MKIIYLHQYFNTPQMAGSTRSYEMARRLVSYGHEVQLITADCRSAANGHQKGWYTTSESGIRVHWLPVPYNNHLSYKKRLNAFFKFAVKAAQKAASIEGDVLFATSTPLTIALPGIYATKRRSIPMVFEVRDLWPEVPVAIGALKHPLLIQSARALEKVAYQFSTRIVALSPGMKEGVVQTGYPSKNIQHIPNSCDLDLFDVPPEQGRQLRQHYSWLGDRPLVVYTGSLGLINNVSYFAHLAHAARQLNPDIRFVVVGNGREEQKVRECAMALGVYNDNFFMFPAIPKGEMARVLSAADLATSFVLNIKATWANSANKFFDALASGTPIAINHEGWQAGLLRDTDAGLVLDPTNTEQAAHDIVQALSKREWLEQAGAAAKKLAREEFSRDLLAKKLERVLLEAVRVN